MKKTYKIDVDCANCANLMEDAARKTSGVQSATVNFMTLKMNVEFEEGHPEMVDVGRFTPPWYSSRNRMVSPPGGHSIR